MKNSFSLLGYLTGSVSPQCLEKTVAGLSVSRMQNFKNSVKRFRWVLLIMTIACLSLPWLMSHQDVSFKITTMCVLMIFPLFLFGDITLTAIFGYKDEKLYGVKETYNAFLRDTISIGGYEITLHESDFLPVTQNWVNTNEEGKAFIKKLAEVRSIPMLKPDNVKDKTLYEEYKKMYEWFQNISSFVPKLSF